MPLIKVEPEGKPVTHRIKLDSATENDFNLYCAFLGNSNESSVFRAVLKHIFAQDDEFITWKKNPDNLAKSATRSRRSRTNNASTTPDSSSPAAPNLSTNGATTAAKK